MWGFEGGCCFADFLTRKVSVAGLLCGSFKVLGRRTSRCSRLVWRCSCRRLSCDSPEGPTKVPVPRILPLSPPCGNHSWYVVSIQLSSPETIRALQHLVLVATSSSAVEDGVHASHTKSDSKWSDYIEKATLVFTGPSRPSTRRQKTSWKPSNQHKGHTRALQGGPGGPPGRRRRCLVSDSMRCTRP